MEEFDVNIECPHCGCEFNETASFNFEEADRGGCNSPLLKSNCWDCDKEFWYRAYVSFDVEVSSVFKKKPKEGAK